MMLSVYSVRVPTWRIPSASSARFFGTTRFLPFEPAREYVQEQRFSTVNDFRYWSRTGQRPAFIPSNPQKYYANDGWTSYPDFFGTTASESLQCSPAVPTKKQLDRLRGAEARTDFIRYAQDQLPNIEFRPLREGLSANMFFRVIEKEHRADIPDLWMPLQLRFSCPHVTGTKYHYLMYSSGDDGPVIVIDDKNQAVGGLRGELKTCIFVSKFLPRAQILSLFQMWWDGSCKKDSESGWLKTLYSRRKLHEKLQDTIDVFRRDYVQPLAWTSQDVRDPCSPTNLVVADGVRLMIRSITPGAVQRHLTLHCNSRRPSAFLWSDFDFVVGVFAEDDEFVGKAHGPRPIFVYPKEFLCDPEMGVFSTSEDSMRPIMCVYPPSRDLRRTTEVSQRRAEQHAPFFCSSVDDFAAIINTYKAELGGDTVKSMSVEIG